ncbi:MAG: sugar ABC transporter permease [Caldilineaceae bacterium]
MQTPMPVNRSKQRAPSKSPGTWKDWRWSLGNVLFVAPFMLLFSVFTLGPIFYSIYMSFFDWEILAKVHPFVGLGNYRDLMTDDLWWLSLRNTLYLAFTAAGNTVFSLAVALGVDQPLIGRVISSCTVFYSPVVMSVAVMAIILGWMMNTQFGRQLPVGVVRAAHRPPGLPAVAWSSHR